MELRLLCVAVLVLVSGCVGVDEGLDSGIQGRAMLGPQCPVERDPPDPDCADKPYDGALAVRSEDGSRIIQQFHTQGDGTFRVAVAPGRYRITEPPDGQPFPTCSAADVVVVEPRMYADVVVDCDTGIR